jgi:hypothetical protein
MCCSIRWHELAAAVALFLSSSHSHSFFSFSCHTLNAMQTCCSAPAVH